MVIVIFISGLLIMNVSLTKELEQYINTKVTSGMYTSASEVIRESLRLMHDQDSLKNQQIARLNQAIELGLAQLESGDTISSADAYQALKANIEKPRRKSS